MSQKDRETQHSANGVGGSNNPAANPGQDKPGKPQDGKASQKQPEDVTGGESDQGKRGPGKDSQR
jgi:hypothetical protein